MCMWLLCKMILKTRLDTHIGTVTFDSLEIDTLINQVYHQELVIKRHL